LKPKAKFGDQLFNPKLERLQQNLALVMSKFYKKQKSKEEALMHVNWLKNQFIDAMAEKKEEVMVQEDNENLKLEKMFDNIKHKSRSNYQSPKNDNGSLLVRFSGSSKYGAVNSNLRYSS